MKPQKDSEKIRQRIRDRLFHLHGIHSKPQPILRVDNISSDMTGKSVRKKTREILEHIPIAGPVIIWLWRILNLPQWFYRLSRHFEGVVEQVDVLISKYTEQNNDVEQIRNALTSLKEQQDSIIHNINTQLDSLSHQLHTIMNDRKEYEKSINQLHRALDSLREQQDSAIHNINSQLDSLSHQLHTIMNDQKEHERNIKDLHNFIKTIRETPHAEDYIIQDVRPALGDSLKHLTSGEDGFYFAFGNIFRGTEAEIEQKQRLYLPFILETLNLVEDKGRYFLDAGCGRGEFMRILKEADIPVKGVTINRAEYDYLKGLGLDVEMKDVNTFLEQIEDNTLIGISGFQIVEHLTQGYLKRFLELAIKKISFNGVIILETVNTKCSVALSNFYLDLSHIRPCPPELLKFLLEWHGFRDMKIIYSTLCPEEFRSKTLPEHNYMDYAVVGWKR